jgi:hypothetical protein
MDNEQSIFNAPTKASLLFFRQLWHPILKNEEVNKLVKAKLRELEGHMENTFASLNSLEDSDEEMKLVRVEGLKCYIWNECHFPKARQAAKDFRGKKGLPDRSWLVVFPDYKVEKLRGRKIRPLNEKIRESL